MKTKSIEQKVAFCEEPDEVYELLMNSKKHSAFTGALAKLSSKPNGKFVTYDGYCHGYNIELERGKKIVQAWHFDEDGWDQEHFSICTFSFYKVATGTKLVFTQTGIPAHKAKALSEGWKAYYWEPMKAFLKNSL